MCPAIRFSRSVFQSTLPREERRNAAWTSSRYSEFQSTLPREERRVLLHVLCYVFDISIHAPTRGATSASDSMSSSFSLFQSTLPREERRIASVQTVPSVLFQSTLPREERPLRVPVHPGYQNFNPRSHERSDLLQLPDPLLRPHFNPRSHERSDAKLKEEIRAQFDFNPRSHERSDSDADCRQLLFYISIHAPTRGATIVCSCDSKPYGFQSTLPREERRLRLRMLLRSVPISIHAPTRGATILSAFSTTFSLFQSTLPREERQQYCTKNLFIFIQYRQ